jgi:hypothetical protein
MTEGAGHMDDKGISKCIQERGLQENPRKMWVTAVEINSREILKARNSEKIICEQTSFEDTKKKLPAPRLINSYVSPKGSSVVMTNRNFRLLPKIAWKTVTS